MLKEQCHEICVPFLGEKLNLGPAGSGGNGFAQFFNLPMLRGPRCHWQRCTVGTLTKMYCGNVNKDVLWEHWQRCTVGTLTKMYCVNIDKDVLWEHWQRCTVGSLTKMYCGNIDKDVLWKHWQRYTVGTLTKMCCGNIDKMYCGNIDKDILWEHWQRCTVGTLMVNLYRLSWALKDKSDWKSSDTVTILED